MAETDQNRNQYCECHYRRQTQIPRGTRTALGRRESLVKHPLETSMHESRALVLKKESRGEADTLFTLYTERFGLIRAVAQGVRKMPAKLKGHLELFNENEITL